jgi:trk system potassium uptake protein TrkH
VVRQAAELRYAVRVRVVAKYSGQLSLVVAVLTAAPLLAAIFGGDLDAAFRYAAVIAVFAGLGTVLARLQAPSRIEANEAITIVAVIFLVTPLAMAYPMSASGLHLLDAVFEAISAVTTTGLTTVRFVESESTTFLFTQAWMQWYGGLGIVVLSLALVVHPGVAARGLSVAETESDDLAGSAGAHARRILIVYGVLTGAGVLGLLLLGTGLFNALVYTLAAVSTGGFSPHNNSVAGLGGLLVQAAVLVIAFLGAVPLALYYRLAREGWKFTANVSQMAALAACGTLTAAALGLCLYFVEGMPLADVLHHAPLMGFSAQTTTGFSTIDAAKLDSASKLVMILAMAVGGGAGSTAGGFKLLRLLILLRVLQALIVRTSLPRHAVMEPSLENRRLEEGEMREALLLIVLFAGVIACSWLPFLAMGYDPLDSLFEVTSATATAGLSAGVTSAGLPALLKGVLCADMLMGRLEIVPWLVMLSRGTWLGRRAETQ